MLETAVEKHLRKSVEKVGGLCEKFVVPGRRGPPDRLITWPWGKMSLVELKKPGEKLDAHQVRDHARRRQRGVFVTVLNSIETVNRYVVAKVYFNSSAR